MMNIQDSCKSVYIDFINMSQEQFFEGYSEYELEAMNIPYEFNRKCLKQMVNYTRCQHKAGVARVMFNSECEDEKARFFSCQQRSVNYYTAGAIGEMIHNNPSLFREKNVSETYESFFPTKTIFNVTR